jgi:hypothetical protein
MQVLMVPQHCGGQNVAHGQQQSPKAVAHKAALTKPKVASHHIYQTTHNWKSTLGNFYHFVLDMEALEYTNLSIMQLWSMPHVHTWILWTNAQVSGSTKHNKALHLIKVLQWLANNCLTATGKAAQEGIKQSLKKLHQFSENSKQQYLHAVSKAMDKEKLINSGAALHKSEQPAFILWLLQHISKCAEFFLPELSSSSDDNGQAVVSSHSCSRIQQVHSLSLSLSHTHTHTHWYLFCKLCSCILETNHHFVAHFTNKKKTDTGLAVLACL